MKMFQKKKVLISLFLFGVSTPLLALDEIQPPNKVTPENVVMQVESPQPLPVHMPVNPADPEGEFSLRRLSKMQTETAFAKGRVALEKTNVEILKEKAAKLKEEKAIDDLKGTPPLNKTGYTSEDFQAFNVYRVGDTQMADLVADGSLVTVQEGDEVLGKYRVSKISINNVTLMPLKVKSKKNPMEGKIVVAITATKKPVPETVPSMTSASTNYLKMPPMDTPK